MNRKIATLASLPLAIAALAGCSSTGADPIQTTPYNGCAIAQTGLQPGEASPSRTAAVESLTITCNGKATMLKGDFTSRATSYYDVEKTGVESLVVVGDEVRIWHDLRSDGTCLTIQRLDESLPSRDTCQIPDERPEEQEPATV